jgi:hypothetical protein
VRGNQDHGKEHRVQQSKGEVQLRWLIRCQSGITLTFWVAFSSK